MGKLLAVLIMWAGIMAFSIPAGAFEAGVREFYWLPKSSGPTRMDSRVLAADAQALITHPEMKNQYYPVVEFFAVIGNHHLNLAYYGAEKENDKKFPTDQNPALEYRSLGNSINSALTHDVYDFIYSYDILNLEEVLSGLSVGLVGRVKKIAEIDDIGSNLPGFGQNEEAPIPMLGVNFQLGIFDKHLETRLLATGVDYEHGTVFDGQADVSFSPLPLVDVYGGYRIFFIHADDSAAQPSSDYVSGGPYFGITLSY